MAILIAGLSAALAAGAPRATWPARAVAGTGEAYPLANVRFVGNVVFENAYYRAALLEWGYGNKRPLRPPLAAKRLQRMLQRRGFLIANVQAQSVGGHIVFHIDEGRLAKVVIMGRGSVRTLQLQLVVSLPHNVYNQELLEKQLDDIQREHGIQSAYELVPATRDHQDFQIDALFDDARPPGFELHIHLASSRWDDGLKLHVTVRGADGLGLGTSYGDHGLLVGNDQWRIRVDAAAKWFRETSSEQAGIGLSRSVFDARWYTPPLFRNRFRPFLWTYADYLVRQRPMEGVEFYRWFRGGALLNLGLQWSDNMMVALGFGAEYRMLIDVDHPDTNSELLKEFQEIRGTSVLQTELIFDPRNPRRDRHHHLNIETRLLVLSSETEVDYLAARWQYQYVREIGWHDLWLRSRALGLLGGFEIMDEEPINQHVRGVFTDVYSARVASGSIEFRFSLWRDLLKLSTYFDAAVYQASPFGPPGQAVQAAFASGVGINFLLLDFAQFDIYYGAGYATNYRWDHGLAARIKKAY
jgi:hypothetical protein